MPYADPEKKREYDRLRSRTPERLAAKRKWSKEHYDPARSKERVQSGVYKRYYRANAERKRMASRKWRLTHPEQFRKQKKAYYDKNREKVCAYVRSNRLRYVYGLSDADFKNLWEHQNHCCAVCFKPIPFEMSRAVAIDHSHETGKVRGFVHQQCNLAVGWIEEHLDIIEAAKVYVSKYNG